MTRVAIGFQGGQVLAVRVVGDHLSKLRDALESGRAERWHQLEAEDGPVLLDLAQVVYLRTEADDQRVGF